MKVRFCLVLVALCAVIFFSGCQRSAGKADAAEVTAGQGETEKVVQVEEAHISDTVKVKTRTVCVRNPETGEIIQKQVPIDAGSDREAKPRRTRTVRTRDPQTGRTITREVPVSTATTCCASDAPKTRTVRIRDPKTGRTVTKQVPIKTTGNQTRPELSREEELSRLEQHIASIQQVMKDPEKMKNSQEAEAWRKLLKALEAEYQQLEAEEKPAEAVDEESM